MLGSKVALTKQGLITPRQASKTMSSRNLIRLEIPQYNFPSYLIGQDGIFHFLIEPQQDKWYPLRPDTIATGFSAPPSPNTKLQGEEFVDLST